MLLLAAGCGQVITETEARDAAFEAAGVDASSVTVTSTQFDDEDDEYEFEFQSDTTRYEYTIDANNGKVLSSEQSALPASSGTNTDGSESQGAGTGSSEGQQSQTGEIDQDQATTAALEHFGKNADEVTNLTVREDTDDGVPVYEVEFRIGTTEYSCEIDRATGAVRSSDTDNN